MTKAPAAVLIRLKAFARERGFRVTHGSGGKHNAGSLHPLNRAIDVSVKGKTNEQVEQFMEAARAAGYRVLDERTRPPGQDVWRGRHLHVEDRREFPEEKLYINRYKIK